ncbi:MAG: outer membrane beta-barrel protein [Gammaproteobacteria bacterium]|nr:outer membrane beta-barrel protein [Gammaproteobacteria bacterium]
MNFYAKAGVRLALIGILLSFVSTNVLADAGDWIVRGRIINVSPNDSSDDALGAGSNTPVGVDAATTLEVDFTYMLKSNLGLELILATTKHDITGEGNLSALGKIAETGVLPPTLTLQYHFSPGANIRLYAGAGLNYTLFYDESTTDSLTGGLGAATTSLDLDTSFGLAAQAGVDVDISGGWFFNADIKYIQIETEATVTADGATASTINVDINPWVFGIGVGKSF